MRQSCECDSTAGKIPGLVKGYNTYKTGRLSRVKPGNFEMAIAAGSLCSTVSDLLRWNLALHRSKKLLSQESYQAMIRPTTLLDGTEVRYGLGLQLNNYLGNQVIFHRGVIEGFLSDARYFPESDLTIVTLINTLGPIKPVNVSNTIAEYFIQKKDRTKVYEGDLSVFAGAYSGKVMGRKLVRNFEVSGNKLFMVLPDQRYLLKYIGNNKWRSEDDYIYTFSAGQETKVQINDPLMSFSFTKE